MLGGHQNLSLLARRTALSLLAAIGSGTLSWSAARVTFAAPPLPPNCVVAAHGDTPLPAGFHESLSSFLSADGGFVVLSLRNSAAETIIERRDLAANVTTASVSRPAGYLFDVSSDARFALYLEFDAALGSRFVRIDLVTGGVVALNLESGWSYRSSNAPILRISDDGRQVVVQLADSAGFDTAVVVDVQTGAVHRVPSSVPGGGQLLAASADASVIALLVNGDVEVVDLNTNTIVGVPGFVASQSMSQLDIVGSGRYLVAGSGISAQVYDRVLNTVEAFGGPDAAIAGMSENGRYLAFVDPATAGTPGRRNFILDRSTGESRTVGNVSGLTQFVRDIADDGETVLVRQSTLTVQSLPRPEHYVTRVGLPTLVPPDAGFQFPVGAVRQMALRDPLPEGTTLNFEGATATVALVDGRTVLTVAVNPSSATGPISATMSTPDGCVVEALVLGATIVDAEFETVRSVTHPGETSTVRYRWRGFQGFVPSALRVGEIAARDLTLSGSYATLDLVATVTTPADAVVGGRDVVIIGSTPDDLVIFPDASLVRMFAGEFHPIGPSRIVDTRDGTGGRTGPLAEGVPAVFDVTGVGGVPDVGVEAVVLNATVDAPTDSSFLTVWPANQPRPNASNLNWIRNQVVPNLVTAKVGPDGTIAVYNNAGLAQVILDVVGWYSSSQSSSAGSAFVAVEPTRLLDTRIGGKPIGQQSSIDLDIAEPGAGISAVALNVTVTEPSASSYLSVVPSGTRPTTSSLNFVAGQVRANFVIVPLGPDGAISFYNNTGSVHVVADIFGFFVDDSVPVVDGQLSSATPQRVLDTRSGTGAPIGKVDPARSVLLDLSGRIPSGSTAVVLNLTVTEPAGSGFATVWPADLAQPGTSNVNYVSDQTVANLVIVPVSPDGMVRLATSGSPAHLVVDLTGWYGPRST